MVDRARKSAEHLGERNRRRRIIHTWLTMLLQCPHENVSPLGHPWDGVSGWCAGCGAIRHGNGHWHMPVRLDELAKAWGLK